jgi:hypothetical protein
VSDPSAPLPHPSPRSELARVRRQQHRWRSIALLLAGLLVVTIVVAIGRGSREQPVQAASPAVAVQAAENPTKAQYASEQDKAEIGLLRQALKSATEVNAHHRHHSRVMWDLIAGRITPREAWWQGGDSTCAGWLAAGEFERAVARLQGREVKPVPIPREGLRFCKQARERK